MGSLVAHCLRMKYTLTVKMKGATNEANSTSGKATTSHLHHESKKKYPTPLSKACPYPSKFEPPFFAPRFGFYMYFVNKARSFPRNTPHLVRNFFYTGACLGKGTGPRLIVEKKKCFPPPDIMCTWNRKPDVWQSFLPSPPPLSNGH